MNDEITAATNENDFAPRAHPDAGLTSEQVDGLYQSLLRERERILGGVQRHVSEAIQDREASGDEADKASHAAEQATLFRLAEKERKLLQQISGALERMRIGEYGICEGTEEPIEYKRLQIRPWTRFSVGYKETIERERKERIRS